MAYKAPHFGNLQKRAKALNMKVTRVTDDEDARAIGHHEYVLTGENASQRTIDNARCYSLSGIRAEIEAVEKINAAEDQVAASEADSVSPPILPINRRDYRTIAKEVMDRLKAAKVAQARRVIDSMRKQQFGNNVGDIKAHMKDSMIHDVAHLMRDDVEFSEHEKKSEWDVNSLYGTDTVITGKVVVMRESELMAIAALIKEMLR